MDNVQAGQNIGPYRILNQVGKGGMATVYRAYQASMDRYVAIKFLPRELAENPQFLGRFQQEARTIARLEHTHILPVYDFGQAEGLTYLVMRYLEAGTLADRLGKGPLPLAEVDRLITQLGSALQYAHARGVIHRDLKPSNVLLDASGSVFLTDFGIAKLLESDSKYTGTGAMIGTPAYMSPEQAQGRPVDERADLYSLGVILYEMVTGRVPYEADTPLAIILKHVNAPLPLPSSVRPGLHPALEKVLLRALAKDPAERFATAGDFLDAWRLAMREVPGLAAAPARPASALTAAAPAAPLGGAGQALQGSTGPAPQASTGQARRGGAGWLGVGGVFLALAVLACGALVCGGVLLSQMISGGLRNRAASTPSQAAEAFTPAVGATVPAEATAGEGVEIPLEAGLPRSLTYGGLTYTVTGAVLDSQARPEEGIFLEGDDRLARLKLSILNPTAGFVYADPAWTRLRLADGAEYNSATSVGVASEPGAAEAQELVFVVPAGTGWDGAVLVVAESGREPAELPLTGDVPPVAFPRAVPLPVPALAEAPDGRLQYELLSAELDLDWYNQRAEVGQRFLKLVLRLTNTGFQSGVAIGPSVFRLDVGGTPVAPLETTIAVIDYQAALDFDVVFAVPAHTAGEATLQLGDVAVPDIQFVTMTLDLTGE